MNIAEVREIKFRGKRIAGEGEWVYGYLVKQFGVHKIYDDSKEDFGDWIYEVDPETIGQYTGLKDEYGNEIYEGDIVDFDGETLDVYMHDDGSWWAGQYIIWEWIDEEENNWKVVGNIFDNPELLEVAE